ncbi:hypothetical protein ACROYT_G037194 [Oculina patagonica]
MTSWRIPLCGRRLLGKRRLVFGVVVASLPFLGYLLLLTPSEKLVIDYSHSPNTAPDCNCAIRQETHPNTDKKAIAPTSGTFKDARKVNHDSSTSLGSLTVHVWTEICGTKVSNLRNWPHFPYFPDKTYSIASFHKIQVGDLAKNGERIFGYVHPPTSGKYRFAIISDGTTELWLSPNEDPAFSKMIARVLSDHEWAWTEEEDYNNYPKQISNEITLHAGKKYYIESLSRQGSEVPHVAVYWSYGSSNSPFEIIFSEYLSRFSKSNRHGAIPFHAGKQRNILIQSKSKLYDFNRLPFINRREYIDQIPTCQYIPSFLVRRKLNKYEGVSIPKVSQVFPEDETSMFIMTSYNEWSKPNQRAERNIVESVVNKFMAYLEPRDYFLRKIHKVIQKPDPKNGDRFLLNLELGLENTNQSLRLSEHVYLNKGKNNLCLPDGMNWNSSATVYFILPVKNQGKWVNHFINQLTDASLLTGDTNFHVIIVDFESKDIDMKKAFNTPLLRNRHTVVSLKGKFYKTLALNKATELVPNAHDIIFLFDLHIDVPADIMDSVRMNTIVGRMTYFPIVGRLDCESSSVEHQGFWQLDGYGIMSIYKSDWDRFGGMNTKEFKYKWGGEDWDLLDRVLMIPVEVERIKYPGLYHHYHDKRRMWN